MALVFKVVAKLKYLVAIIGGHLTTNCQIYDRTKFHKVKGIDNAFDQMELCFVSKTFISSVKIGLVFQEITFIPEFLGSNFLLPTFFNR